MCFLLLWDTMTLRKSLAQRESSLKKSKKMRDHEIEKKSISAASSLKGQKKNLNREEKPHILDLVM